MKIYRTFDFGDDVFYKGQEVAWYNIYPSMVITFGVWFFVTIGIAYNSEEPIPMVYYFGGSWAVLFSYFSFCMFGPEALKWLFINIALGSIGVFVQIGWYLAYFGKSFSDYPFGIHAIIALLYILGAFLIRNLFIDMVKAREIKSRQKIADNLYIYLVLLIDVVFYLDYQFRIFSS